MHFLTGLLIPQSGPSVTRSKIFLECAEALVVSTTKKKVILYASRTLPRLMARIALNEYISFALKIQWTKEKMATGRQEKLMILGSEKSSLKEHSTLMRVEKDPA
ncbi:hypothetical protein JTB14_025595 [Gonioctena quinquepunctata]|nr:hypothetical protein JTB14_025595 [Gonioctena quinquepunctata]